MTQERRWTRDDLPPELSLALDLAVGKQARGPAVLRVTEIAGYTDWVLLLSGRSDRQVRAIVEAILDGVSEQDRRPVGTDGLADYNWALLDYDNFIVHVFYHPVRKYYDLESMWHDAPRVDLGLPAEVLDMAGLENLAPPEPMPEFRGSIEFGGFDDEFDRPAPIEASRLAAAKVAAADSLADGNLAEDEDDLFDD